MAEQKEPKVYELMEKGDCYTLYQLVKMEDAINVFFSEEDMKTMHQPRCQMYSTYSGLSKMYGQEGYGTWMDQEWNSSPDAVLQAIFVDMDRLLAKLVSAFSDPKTKVVPFDLPYGGDQLMGMNKTTVAMGFGYSEAKKGFVRKPLPTEKKVLGKAAINDMQRRVAGSLDTYLAATCGFTNVRISTTASKREMRNSVVIMKKFGLKLEELFSSQDWNGDKWVRSPWTFDQQVQKVAEYHKLSPALQKQLKEVIVKWWNECIELER